MCVFKISDVQKYINTWFNETLKKYAILEENIFSFHILSYYRLTLEKAFDLLPEDEEEGEEGGVVPRQGGGEGGRGVEEEGEGGTTKKGGNQGGGHFDDNY